MVNHTTGCSVVQGVSIFDKIFDIVTTMTMNCTAITKVVKNDQVQILYYETVPHTHYTRGNSLSFIYISFDMNAD